MTHRSFRNSVGVAAITGLSLLLVACGGSSSSTPAAVNHAPTGVTINGSASGKVGHTQIFNLSATDPDGDTVTFSTTSAGATISGTVLTYVPTTAGVQTITVTATDSKGATATGSTGVLVAANGAPQFNGSINTTVVGLVGGSDITVPVGATDPDGDTVTIAAVGALPAWATFASGTLTVKISLFPTALLGTTQNLTLRATDGYGGQTDLTFSVTVRTAPFVVTNSLYPSIIIAGRNYPATAGAGLPIAPATVDTFSFSCNAQGLAATDTLTWVVSLDGSLDPSKVLATKTTAGNVTSVTFDGQGTQVGSVRFPLADSGNVRQFSLLVLDGHGGSARQDYSVNPQAPNFPFVSKVALNDVRGLRSNGLMPVWNADKAVTSLTWPAQNIDLTLTGDDTFGATGQMNMLPYVFSNPRAIDTATGNPLAGTITLTTATAAKATLVFTPAAADFGLVPRFKVDITDAAGLKTTATIDGLIAAAADNNVIKTYAGTTTTTEVVGATAGQALVAVRDNHAPTIANGATSPAQIAAEEGSTPYTVLVGTLAAVPTANLVIGDPDTIPGVNLDYSDALGTLPGTYAGPGTKAYASGYLKSLDLAPQNGDTIDTSEVVFTRALNSIVWNPSHPNVRKELQFTVKAADLYDAFSNSGKSWISQVSAVITGSKLDTVLGGVIPAAETPFNVPGGDARVLHFWPVRTKGTTGAVISPAAPYATGLSYGLTGPVEFGVTAGSANKIFATPTTNAAYGTTGVAAQFTSRGLNVDNDGTNAVPTANVVPYGYYMVKVDDARAGARAVDINGRRFFSNVTDGLDLSKTYLGRDVQDNSALAAVLGANANLRVATVNGLTTWDSKHSALQFTNTKLSNGNVFLNISTTTGGVPFAYNQYNVLNTTKLLLPYPGVHSLTQNVAAPGSAAGQTNSPLLDNETGTSNGALVANFAGLVTNSGTAADGIFITQLAPKTIAIPGGGSIYGMAVTKSLVASPAPLPAIAAGAIKDFLNTNTTATTATADSWYVNIKRSSFYSALAATAGASAVPASYASYNNEFFGVFQAHQGFADGFEKNAALLLNFQNLKDATGIAVDAAVANSADLDLGTVTFGNPFTAGTKVAAYSIQSSVAVSNGTTAAAAAAGNDDNGTIAKIATYSAAAATAGAGGYAPGITPVTGVTFQYTQAADLAAVPQTTTVVDVANRLTSTAVTNANALAYGQGTAANGTAAFSLSWTAPAAYSGADVEIWSYNAGAATPVKVTTFTTGGASILIPATLLPAGNSYFFRIRAYNMPGVNFNTTPLKRTLPMSFADFVTQAIIVS